MKQLRPYQENAIQELRSALALKLKPVLSAPTGSGKTRIASEIFALARVKNKRVCFCVPFLSLIRQTYRAFVEAGIDEREIGIIQANNELTDWSRPVQIASIDTLSRRPKFPDVDVVIFDEVHNNSVVYKRWMEASPNTYFIGLSATPWASGMSKLWDKMIVVSTVAELIKDGYLSPFKYYAPSVPDLRDVKIVAGDYQKDQLALAMSKADLIADIVTTWIKKGENRPTFCFAVNRRHAQEIQHQFLNAGIPAGYVDAYTPVEEREAMINQLRDGELKVICNIGTMTTGVDAPFVSCIILARPTKSEMLFVQIIGRGLRTNPDKQDCIILDHSSTALNLGRPDEIFYDHFRGGQSPVGGTKADKKEKEDPKPRACPSCGFLLLPKEKDCPSCGYVFPPPSSDVYVADGELAELGSGGKLRKVKFDEKQSFWSGLLYLAEERGRARSWALANYKNKFGVWPRNLKDKPEYPTKSVKDFVKSRSIAWAKRMEKERILTG